MRILYIDIDSLNPLHLGCHGYPRNTSPHIDFLAKEGVRFTNCHTSDAPCLPSRTALYTGQFGIHTGVVGHGGTAAEPFSEGSARGFKDRWETGNLAVRLQQAGFHTAMISPFARRHAARHVYAGFSEIHATSEGGWETADTIAPLVRDWLNKRATEDQWFLHLNFWDPHTPYRTPAHYPNPFQEDPVPDWLTPERWRDHLNRVGPHKPQEVVGFHDRIPAVWPAHHRQPGALRTWDALKQMFDGYDTGIRYVDDAIGEILEQLRQAGVYEETAIIISADHGENMGELGIYGEHGTADAATCRVPMIIKWPGGRQGVVAEGLHYGLDLAPTLAELLGFDPNPDWDGKSFAPTLLNGVDCARDYLVVSQCAHVCQRSVRFGPWLYMRTYHDGFHLFPREMLFNLADDPHEQEDLASTHPEVCHEAMARLLEWHDACMLSSTTNIDPLWTVMREGGPYHARGRLADYCEYLRETGRAWAVEELRNRHPGEFSSNY